MENAAKALTIAGGVLLAVIIIVSIVFVFNAMSQPQNEREAALEAEQLAAFNQEYEVYNKKLMYGVDLLSVLNKAYSGNMKNNSKNTSVSFGFSFDSDENYQVNIAFKLKSELKATGEVRFEKNYNGSKSIVNYADSTYSGTAYAELEDSVKGISIKKCIDDNYQNNITDMNINAYKIVMGNGLDNLTIDKIVSETEFESKIQGNIEYSIKENTEIMKALVEEGVQYELTNNNSIEDNSGVSDESIITKDEWYKIILRTPTYDLKNRKFKCESVEYDSETGRISRMYFVER